MLSSVLAPIAAAGLVTLAVPTISYAATLASPAIINFDDCTGGCGQTQGSTTANFGSVTFTQVGTSEIDFTINLASGYDFFNSGNGTSFEFNTSDTSGLGTVASPPSNWSFVKPANSLDGLGAFQYGLQCGATGGTPNKTCGSTLTFDITGLNSNNIINNARGVFIAVDICFVSGTTCAGTGPVAVTGSAGVTPIPPALAMLAPVFGLGFFGLRRRRRQSGVASA
jgi:hypothetical protein